MAETSLTRTFTTDNSNVYKWTYSVWVKRSGLGADQAITAPTASGTIQGRILFRSDDQLEVYDYRNGYILQKKTNRQFRDTSAWYHIVVSNDNSVSSPDTKIYINGVEETSFAIDNEYPQNETNTFNSNIANYIGTYSTGDYFSGSMSHFHFIDGTAYDATAFGEYDANGVWTINTSPSVTYGTNGFFILKDGNSVTDQSGNGNNFTVGIGTLTKTEDSPSNVFATMNALQYSPNTTFSNGNNVVTQSVGGNGARRFTSSLGASSGKYYWETKITGTVNGMTFGIVDGVEGDYNNYVGYKSKEVGYEKDGVIYKNAVITDTGFAVLVLNDIVNHALDLDNGYIYFGVNGTWQNSGVPTSGATGTGGFSITADTLYHPAVSAFANTGQISFNFGNGYFGTTAVSSAQNPDDGIGIFVYDVPAGYYALNTKAINAQEYD